MFATDVSICYSTYAGLAVSWSGTNPPPTGITNTGLTVPENSPAGFVITTLSIVDVMGDSAASWTLNSGNVALSGTWPCRTSCTYVCACCVSVRAVCACCVYGRVCESLGVRCVCCARTGFRAHVCACVCRARLMCLCTGNNIVVRSGVVMNFEAGTTFPFSVTVTDTAGGFFTTSFTVVTSNVNEAPTSLTLSSSTVPENSAVGTLVGFFGATDVDALSSFSYVPRPPPPPLTHAALPSSMSPPVFSPVLQVREYPALWWRWWRP